MEYECFNFQKYPFKEQLSIIMITWVSRQWVKDRLYVLLLCSCHDYACMCYGRRVWTLIEPTILEIPCTICCFNKMLKVMDLEADYGCVWLTLGIGIHAMISRNSSWEVFVSHKGCRNVFPNVPKKRNATAIPLMLIPEYGQSNST